MEFLRVCGRDATGDAVLKRVAALLSAATRENAKSQSSERSTGKKRCLHRLNETTKSKKHAGGTWHAHCWRRRMFCTRKARPQKVLSCNSLLSNPTGGKWGVRANLCSPLCAPVSDSKPECNAGKRSAQSTPRADAELTFSSVQTNPCAAHENVRTSPDNSRGTSSRSSGHKSQHSEPASGAQGVSFQERETQWLNLQYLVIGQKFLSLHRIPTALGVIASRFQRCTKVERD